MTPAVGEHLARLPSVHLLRSAIIAASVLDSTGVAVGVAHQSYIKLPTGGIYHSDDLQRGERLLIRCGLLREDGELLYPSEQLQRLRNLPGQEAAQVLLALALQTQPPLWMYMAVREEAVWPEFIADGDAAVLSQIIPDADQREAFLLSLGNRFDADAHSRVGALGEEAVVNQARIELQRAGRADLGSAVHRVSLISDQLGYDVVAPTLAGPPRRMEVKTTSGTSKTRIEVHLSRNEARVGLRDTCWALVICRACGTDCASVLGWCRADAFGELLPRDADARACWAVTKLLVHTELLRPGLPPQ